jgi:hypothetical protein
MVALLGVDEKKGPITIHISKRRQRSVRAAPEAAAGQGTDWLNSMKPFDGISTLACLLQNRFQTDFEQKEAKVAKSGAAPEETHNRRAT